MTDNASNNTTMVSAIVDHLQNVSIVNYDADNLHVHCLAHVLNLAVQSVFSIINIHQPKAIKVGPSTSASESDVDSAGEEDGNGVKWISFLMRRKRRQKCGPHLMFHLIDAVWFAVWFGTIPLGVEY